MKILLRREEVNPNVPDEHGRTPFSYAASSGSERVVKTLLEWEEVNPDQPDINGRTPLSFAANRGHERVVNILLGREEVNRGNGVRTRLSLPRQHPPDCLPSTTATGSRAVNLQPNLRPMEAPPRGNHHLLFPERATHRSCP